MHDCQPQLTDRDYPTIICQSLNACEIHALDLTGPAAHCYGCTAGQGSSYGGALQES